MKHQSKLSREQQQQLAAQQQTQQQAGREFSSPEEMLRFDASQTRVPPGIAQRLGKSTGGAKPKGPWWRRLFER